MIDNERVSRFRRNIFPLLVHICTVSDRHLLGIKHDSEYLLLHNDIAIYWDKATNALVKFTDADVIPDNYRDFPILPISHEQIPATLQNAIIQEGAAC